MMAMADSDLEDNCLNGNTKEFWMPKQFGWHFGCLRFSLKGKWKLNNLVKFVIGLLILRMYIFFRYPKWVYFPIFFMNGVTLHDSIYKKQIPGCRCFVMSFVIRNISDTCPQHELYLFNIFKDWFEVFSPWAWKTTDLHNGGGLSNTNWLFRNTANIKNKMSALKVWWMAS